MLLRASFPPGSVTGAPKIRAMELINALEATAREAYTGAIGIASPVSGLELNVAIRTFELAEGRVWLGVGGGVVADSEPVHELAECLDKARPLLEAIGADLDEVPRQSAPIGPAPTSRRRRPGFTGRSTTGRVRDRARARGAASRARVASRPTGRQRVVVVRVVPVTSPRSAGNRGREPHGPTVADCGCSCARPREVRSASTSRLMTPPTPSPASRCRRWHLSRRCSPAVSDGTSGRTGACSPKGVGRSGSWPRSIFCSSMRTPRCSRPRERTSSPSSGHSSGRRRWTAAFWRGRREKRSSVLPGRAGFEVSQGPLAIEELVSADEIFVTSSIRGLCAVSRLGEDRHLDGGPVSSVLAEALWKSWSRAVAPASRGCGRRPGSLKRNARFERPAWLGISIACGVQPFHDHCIGEPRHGRDPQGLRAVRQAEIERRLALAHKAYSSYRRTSFEERARLVRAMADVLEADQAAHRRDDDLGDGKAHHPGPRRGHKVRRRASLLRRARPVDVARRSGGGHRRQARRLHQVPADRPGSRRHALELPALAGHPLCRPDVHGRQRRALEARFERASDRTQHRGSGPPCRLRRGSLPDPPHRRWGRQGDPGGRPRRGRHLDRKRGCRSLCGLHRRWRDQKDGARARRRRPVHRDALCRHRSSGRGRRLGAGSEQRPELHSGQAFHHPRPGRGPVLRALRGRHGKARRRRPPERRDPGRAPCHRAGS